jgi:hypothetical protein
MSQWIIDAWDRLSAEDIKQAFTSCGMGTNLANPEPIYWRSLRSLQNEFMLASIETAGSLIRQRPTSRCCFEYDALALHHIGYFYNRSELNLSISNTNERTLHDKRPGGAHRTCVARKLY